VLVKWSLPCTWPGPQPFQIRQSLDRCCWTGDALPASLLSGAAGHPQCPGPGEGSGSSVLCLESTVCPRACRARSAWRAQGVLPPARRASSQAGWPRHLSALRVATSPNSRVLLAKGRGRRPRVRSWGGGAAPAPCGRPRWVPRVGEPIWGVAMATASLTVTLDSLEGYARAGRGLLAPRACQERGRLHAGLSRGARGGQGRHGGRHHRMGPLRSRARE